MELSDEALQRLTNVYFDHSQRINDNETKASFYVSADAQDVQGNKIECSTNEECLNKWIASIKEPQEGISYIYRGIFGKNIQGIEYRKEIYTYEQFFQDFIFMERGQVWRAELIIRNGTPNEIDSMSNLFNLMLSTFKFLE